MIKSLACISLLVGITVHAQTSNVTATVKDSDNQTWNNGTYQITFVPPTGYQGTVYTFGGVGWTPHVYNGNLSNNGVFSVAALERNDAIVPANSHWKFTFCPNASFRCSDSIVAVNQVSQDISSQLTLTAPRFPASNSQTGSFGYADVEVSPIPAIGLSYWNVNLSTARFYDGTVWVSGGSGGGGALGGDTIGPSSDNTTSKVNHGTIPTTKTIVGTNTSGQFIDASSATLSNNTTGNAATATTATTAGTATHALNLPPDFATQSAAAPNNGSFSNMKSLVTPVADVRAYGAVMDGVSDDAPAARSALAAVTAAGGGTVYFPKGNYYFGTPASSGNAYLFAQGNHIHFKCDPGAIINTAPGIPTLFSMGYPKNGYIQTWTTGGTAPYKAYQANTQAAGLSSITLTAPASTSAFAVGDPIYILGGGGIESNGDGEINWVTAIDAVGGVLSLARPTSKAYAGNNSNVGTPGIVTVMDGAGQFWYDQSIEGCRATPGADFSFFGQIIGGRILNNRAIVQSASNRGMMMNSYGPMAEIEIAGNSYTMANNSALIQFADGMRDFYVHDNTFTDPYGQQLLNVSQGIVNIHISHNNLYLTNPPGVANSNVAVIVFSTAYDVLIDHNFIVMNNQNSGSVASAIVTGLSNGSCYLCVIDGNFIRMNGGFGTAIVVTGLVKITNNYIEESGHKGVLLSGAHATFTGNTIHNVGSAALYILEIAAADILVSGNYIYSDVANSPAIRVGVAGISTIVGNHFTGTQKAIQVDAGAPVMLSNTCDAVTTTTNCGSPSLTTGSLGDWTNAGITNGYAPLWNSTTGKWTPGPVAASTNSLSDWTNVGIANGLIPIWNSASSKWTPGPQTAPCLIATGSTLGCIMPDGTTVTIDGTGKLSVAGGSLSANCALTKYTIPYNDAALAVANTTPTKTLITMPNTSTRICALEISGTTSFAGTSCTAATVRVQSGAGTPLLYTPNQDIFGTVGPTTNNFWTDAGHIADRTNQAVVAAFALTGCNGTALTGGSVDITVGLRAMP